MKKQRLILMVAAAFCFAAAPAFAQHTHGGPAGGAGGSHGPAMNNGAADHSADVSTKGTASSSPAVLSNNSKLDSKLTTKLQAKGLLPANTDLKDACGGFRNLGQCIAAIHVSHNLGISFDCLKANMTGVAAPAGSSCPAKASASTGTSKMSLGKSIQALAPTANSKTESKTATTQADADIKEAQSAS
jgi:hypothetical protein